MLGALAVRVAERIESGDVEEEAGVRLVGAVVLDLVGAR